MLLQFELVLSRSISAESRGLAALDTPKLGNEAVDVFLRGALFASQVQDLERL